MKIMREYNLKGKEIFVGLEDSKKSWKLCVIYNKEVVDRISIPAKYEVLVIDRMPNTFTQHQKKREPG